MTSPSHSMRRAMPRIEIELSVIAAVAPAAAWEVISNFERNPEWQQGMESCRWLTPPPLALGSRYEQRAGFLGREIVSIFEVVELEPGRRITIDTIKGTFPITVTRAVAPRDTGCAITAQVRGDADGWFRLAGPLLRVLVKRSVAGDYARLKELLEAQ